MEIDDINKLKRNINGGLYDVSQATFQYANDVPLYEYIVQMGEEMRMDLVCSSIYKNNNVKYIDILCSINNIDNPLNVKTGQSIVYPSEADITRFRYEDPMSKENKIKDAFTKPNKSTRQDSSRKQYLENNTSLPPTILDTPIDPFDLDGDNYIIGKGLF
jgi:hypothetical protein